MTEEQRVIVKEAMNRPEVKTRISETLTGHKASTETRAKMSIVAKNRRVSRETRAKISAAHMGFKVSPETRAKMSATMSARTGPLASHWRGGPRVSSCKRDAKRRLFGFVPLNKPFVGSEGHHVDSKYVIHMPKALHRSVYHRQTDGRGMAQINAIAYDFLFSQC